jgi:hypothetical protein
MNAFESTVTLARPMIYVRANRNEPLKIVNESKCRSFIWKSFNSKSYVRFSGLFELTAMVWLGRLDVGEHNNYVRKILPPYVYTFSVFDMNAPDTKFKVSIEYDLPWTYPFAEMALRIDVDDVLVYSQGRKKIAKERQNKNC